MVENATTGVMARIMMAWDHWEPKMGCTSKKMTRSNLNYL